ncbi:MAG: hypothetical protein ACI9XB_000409 [Gammaproteobacteria bacterium]|jgi:uncharacterized protein (DUF1800 family)
MDRRTTLGLFLGQKKAKVEKAATTALTFSPYTGPWDWEQAAHLLRRTTFGPTQAQITEALSNGLEATIEQLFAPQPLADPPIYYNFNNDPNIALGESWIDDLETPGIPGLRGARKQSFYAWCFKNMKEEETSIREKMLLFWHNHFVVINTNTGRRLYTYVNLMKEQALGNFKTLVEEMTVDPSMLRFLNGNTNTENGPNENYARELLELFTIGKGETAGPGDYTNYTEVDVVQIARALTGWRDFNPANNNDPTESGFVSSRHDSGDKQLSPRFDNAIISNQEENEYKAVVNIIFQKEEVARFICRKLYSWFIHSEITGEVEVTVIEPMAQQLIDENYEIANPLKALLSSQHFYDMEIRGCMLTHPIEHLFKVANTFEVPMSTDILTAYKNYKLFHLIMNDAEMGIHDHPTVAGWKAFYQAPQYDKLWINAVSLPLRQQYANHFVDGYNNNGYQLKINVLDFAASLTNPLDPNELIREIASIIFAQPLTNEQLVALKEVLIPGLPDFEWTVEYGDYLGGNASLESSIDNKLRTLIGAMVNMPEFHLI